MWTQDHFFSLGLIVVGLGLVQFWSRSHVNWSRGLYSHSLAPKCYAYNLTNTLKWSLNVCPILTVLSQIRTCYLLTYWTYLQGSIPLSVHNLSVTAASCSLVHLTTLSTLISITISCAFGLGLAGLGWSRFHTPWSRSRLSISVSLSFGLINIPGQTTQKVWGTHAKL